MPRQPHPWYREGRGWYEQIDGQQTFLGEHPTHLPKPKKDEAGWHPPQAIREEFHRRMAGRADRKPQPLPTGNLFVAAVLDAYLDWFAARVREGSKAQRTYDWYRKYLQSFLNSAPRLTVEELDPIHVYRWVDIHPGWKTGKRGAMVSVQRALNWAAKAGLLKAVGGKSPLASLEKPAQGHRELLVSEEEYREVLGLVDDQEFRDLLELSWETGCRPHELFTVEAAFTDLEIGRWVFPIRFSKGKKVQRVVYLSERALDITRRLSLKHPSGPLLLNTDGRPWCVSSVKCRFQMICRNLGRSRLRQLALVPPKVPRLKAHERKDPAICARHEQQVLERRKLVNDLAKRHGKRYNLYAFRHSYITESLVSGLDAVTVSVLAGHRDTTTTSRTYAHLAEKTEHLRDAARKVRGA